MSSLFETRQHHVKPFGEHKISLTNFSHLFKLVEYDYENGGVDVAECDAF